MHTTPAPYVLSHCRVAEEKGGSGVCKGMSTLQLGSRISSADRRTLASSVQNAKNSSVDAVALVLAKGDNLILN